MNRQTDGAGLVHDGAFDGLANPPGGIGGETEATLGIELLNRPNQPQVAFLDQVEQCQPAVDVPASNLDHQPEITLDHTLTAALFAFTGKPREVHLFFRGKQGRKTNFVKVQLSGIQLLLAGVVLSLRGKFIFNFCGFVFGRRFFRLVFG